MHPEFRRWSRQAAVEIDESRLASNWANVEKIRTAWQKGHAQDVHLALELARMVLGFAPRDRDALAKLLKPLEESGALEVQIALAMVLWPLLEKSGNLNTVVAYALSCVAFAPACRVPMPQLLNMARARLSEDAVRLRRRGKITLLELPDTPEISIPKALETTSYQLQTPQGWQNIPLMDKNAMKSFAEATESGLSKTADYCQEVRDKLFGFAQELYAAQRLPDERIDLFTWAQGGYSLSRQVLLASLSVPERILPAARELAELTQILPGPYAAPALLHQFLGTPAPEQTVTIREAILAQDYGWRREIPSMTSVEDLCPVSCLLRTLSGDAEPDAVSLSADLQTLAARTVHPTRLALQLYEELLLSRLVEGGH